MACLLAGLLAWPLARLATHLSNSATVFWQTNCQKTTASRILRCLFPKPAQAGNQSLQLFNNSFRGATSLNNKFNNFFFFNYFYFLLNDLYNNNK
jgi:hypothetical protein